MLQKRLGAFKNYKYEKQFFHISPSCSVTWTNIKEEKCRQNDTTKPPKANIIQLRLLTQADSNSTVNRIEVTILI